MTTASKPISKVRKALYAVLGVALVFLAVLLYFQYFFPLGDEGTKAGTLNYMVHKGYIFKTYEGKLIQQGFRSGVPGSVESNEFVFSVSDEKVAKQLMLNTGSDVRLRYKEYRRSVPWRGHSKFVADSILEVRPLQSLPL